jgi:hypothetical protein
MCNATAKYAVFQAEEISYHIPITIKPAKKAQDSKQLET